MDLLVDLSSLSEEIREKLAELDLELSEGKVFQYQNGVYFVSLSLLEMPLKYCVWIIMF